MALAVKLHPDKNGGDKSFEEEFKKVNAAYQTLGDKYKRQIYDNKLNYSQNAENYSPKSEEQSRTYNPPPFSAPNSTSYSSGESNFNPKYMFIAIGVFLVMGIIGHYVYVFMQKYSAKHHYENALTAIKKQHWSMAYSELSNSLDFNSDNPEVYALRAEICIKYSFNYRNAYYDYNLAIHKSEKPPLKWYLERGICAFKMEDSTKALADLSYVLKEDKNNSEAYLNRALTYNLLTNNFGKAIDDFEKYVDLNPEKKYAIADQLAYAKFNLGKYDEAISYYSIAIIGNPTDGKLYFNRAICHKENDDKTNACSDLLRSFERGYDDAKYMISEYCALVK